MASSQHATAVLLAAAVASCVAIQPRTPVSATPADAPEGSLVRPFAYDRKLVVCNAYPSPSPMFVQMNSRDLVKGQPIGFGECRSLGSNFQVGDRLDLTLRDEELHSTFAVDSLPGSDAEMVLVPHKRKDGPMIRFHSMALPIRSDGKDAQLALIDTFAGNMSAGHLRMEDHIFQVPTGKNGKVAPAPKTKRMEDLGFDRVYSIEAGLYDAAVDAENARPVNLLQDQNYVFIRTGGGQSNFPESLVVFPDTPMPPPPPVPKSGSRSAVAIAMPLMAILALALVVLP